MMRASQDAEEDKPAVDFAPLPEIPAKTFRHARKLFLDGEKFSGDVSLTGFILQHCLGSSPPSLGWIGLGPEPELLALNAAVGEQGSFVVLNTEASQSGHLHLQLAEMRRRLQDAGFAVRVQVADLTLPGRWPQLLQALSTVKVGVVGLDARWARAEPRFWETLSGFVRSTGAIVHIRGLLDAERPDLSIAFLRAMPDDSALEVVAATPASVWFAPGGPMAAAVRRTLRSSRLFPDDRAAARFEEAGPVIVRNESAAGFVNDEGRFPRAMYGSGSDRPDGPLPDPAVPGDALGGIEFSAGWSSAEADGRWTDGAEAILTITPPAESGPFRELLILGNPWIPPDKPGQVVAFGIGRKPKSWTEVQFTADEIKSVKLDLRELDLSGPRIVLKVKVQNPGRPVDHGGADPRVLGFKFRSLRLYA